MNSNKQAVGAYIRYLRQHKGMSATRLAADLDTSEGQIRSIEKGRTDTRTSMMANILSLLGGDMTDVAYLILSDAATEETGRRLAAQWLQAHGDQAAEQAQRVAESPVGYNVTSHQE
jgi:transcriptional regulator with XRE-family HTH domain